MTKNKEGRVQGAKKKCPFCKGNGQLILAGEMASCKICKGTGYI